MPDSVLAYRRIHPDGCAVALNLSPRPVHAVRGARTLLTTGPAAGDGRGMERITTGNGGRKT